MTELFTQDAVMFFDRAPRALALYEALARRVLERWPQAQIRVRRTQIGFYDGGLFACASLTPVRPKAQRPDPFLTVSFSLDHPEDAPRLLPVQVRPNRWTHHALIGQTDEIDDELMGWIGASHALAARNQTRQENHHA